MPSDVSPEQKEYALEVAQDYYRGDLVKAAKYLNISVATIKRWQRDAEKATPPPFVITGRPKPPEALLDDYETDPIFAPAPELKSWVRETFLAPGSPLYNEEHDHLADAHLACLWTNVAYRRQGRDVAGMAEMPSAQGHLWLKSRVEYQLTQWFGLLPDFLITLYAPYVSRAADASFCAIVEHELYHCGQKEDAFGGPAFNRITGEPVFFIRGHDVEEFVGVVRRYGVGAASAGVKQLVQAAYHAPEIAEADIALACGVCGAKF